MLRIRNPLTKFKGMPLESDFNKDIEQTYLEKSKLAEIFDTLSSKYEHEALAKAIREFPEQVLTKKYSKILTFNFYSSITLCMLLPLNSLIFSDIYYFFIPYFMGMFVSTKVLKATGLKYGCRFSILLNLMLLVSFCVMIFRFSSVVSPYLGIYFLLFTAALVVLNLAFLVLLFGKNILSSGWNSKLKVHDF